MIAEQEQEICQLGTLDKGGDLISNKSKEDNYMFIKRIKNPLFWITLIGLFFTSTGLTPEEMTSWGILLNSILDVLKNPFTIGMFALAIYGQFYNPATKGFKD